MSATIWSATAIDKAVASRVYPYGDISWDIVVYDDDSPAEISIRYRDKETRAFHVIRLVLKSL